MAGMRPKNDLVAFWLPVIISLLAVAFTGLQWWESHVQGRFATDASMSFSIDTDPSDFKFGFALRSVGPGAASVRSLIYFVDGVQ